MLKVRARSLTSLAEKDALARFKVENLWRFQRSGVKAYIEAQKRKQQQKTQ